MINKSNGIKKRFISFMKDNEGMETLEVAAIAIGTVALLVTLAEIYEATQNKMKGAGTKIDGEFLDD